jgi:hypothetical protein
MTFHAPPIVKLAECLLLEIERAVRQFSRFDRHPTGDDLRAQVRKVLRLARQAYAEPRYRRDLVDDLVREIDTLKGELQIAALLRAFTSKARFEQLARICRELGMQAGGWKKDLHRSSQNGQSQPRHGQRGQILSTPAASVPGANA